MIEKTASLTAYCQFWPAEWRQDNMIVRKTD